MAAASARTPERDAMFLTALELGNTVIRACFAAGYTRRSVYRWREEDPAFASAWHAAVATALEAEADHRLRDRYERPVTYRGLELGTRNVCPDPLLFARYDALRRAQHECGARAAPLPATAPTPPKPASWWARAAALFRHPKHGRIDGR